MSDRVSHPVCCQSLVSSALDDNEPIRRRRRRRRKSDWNDDGMEGKKNMRLRLLLLVHPQANNTRVQVCLFSFSLAMQHVGNLRISSVSRPVCSID